MAVERHTRGGPPAIFEGHCRRCDRTHRFLNDVARAVEAVEELFCRLDTDPAFAEVHGALRDSRGKMIGALVASSADGSTRVLYACSGELAGRRDWPRFVGPVLRRGDTAALEQKTLARIAELEREIATCDVEGAQRRLDEARAAVRTAAALRRADQVEWDRARRAGVDRDAFEAARRIRREAIAADAARVETARDALLAERARLHQLTSARRDASRVLSRAMFDAMTVTNARGERHPLRDVFVGDRIAGGTADCTVPKLLEAANVAGLRPHALAEAWWGPTLNGRVHGEFQLPCDRKCRPILGHLLCGRDG